MFIVITHVAIGDGTSVSYLMMVPHSGNGSLQGDRGLHRVAGAFELAITDKLSVAAFLMLLPLISCFVTTG